MPDRAQETPSGFWPWLAARLFPRGTNLIFWAAYVILIGLLILYVLDPPGGLDNFRFYSSVVVLASILVINILWDDLLQQFPNLVTGLWVMLTATAVMALYTVAVGRMFMAIYLLFMIAAQANASLPGMPAILFSALISAAYMAILVFLGASPAEIQGTLLGLLIGMTFTVTLSQVLHRYTEQTERANQLLAQLQQAHAALVAARQKEKDLAVAEERVRVARDLHDGLGHHLTALSIQLQAAEKLVQSKPELAAEALANARGEAQAALKEVRQSVAALREAPVDLADLPQAIAALAEESARLSGLETRFEQVGEAVNLSPAAAVALYRAAQEGLTNAQKHAAGASRVEVRLAYEPLEVRLSVCDDGQVEAPAGGMRGYGLPGLRERALLLGGSLEHGPRQQGGFALEMILPTAAQTEETA